MNCNPLIRFLILTVITIYLPAIAGAQVAGADKAQQLMEKGQEYIRQKKYDKAEKYLIKSLEAAPSFTEAYRFLGFFYCERKQYAKAAEIFEKAANTCHQCASSFALPLADALCRAQQYTQASAVLAAWKAPGDTLQNNQYRRVMANIRYGMYAAGHITKEEPVNMGLAINSRYDEYFPSITPDDSQMVFTRKTNGIDEDFYKGRRDPCGGWFLARDMGSPPNSIQQEGAQYLSADGHYLFFMRCGNRSVNGWEAGGCDLYFSYTEADGWSQPVAFGATINTTGYEGMPSLSSDNRELFFVSNKEGGYGGMDIWVTRFENGLWQIPENLGPEINTPFDETAPYIAPDNKTLYFTSDGHPGLGGNDIYVTRRNESRIWSRAENLGLPLNSGYEDVSFCISADGTKAYLSSDRPGGFGGMDLYDVQVPEAMRPQPVTFVKGIVYDSLSKEPVTYAQIEFTDEFTGESAYHFVSNRGDGSYMGAINLDRTYGVKVYRVGYLEAEDTVTYTAAKTAVPDTLNFALLLRSYRVEEELPAPVVKDTTLLVVNFKRNEVTINEATRKQVYELMKNISGTGYELYINGYTDNSGNTFINEDVSFARARALANCIRETGISEEKLHLQGWADANPLAPNDTEENRYKNRRVELILRQPASVY